MLHNLGGVVYAPADTHKAAYTRHGNGREPVVRSVIRSLVR